MKGFNSSGEPIELPDPPTNNIMKAKVIALKMSGENPVPTTVNNKPVKVGDVVDVDENTFRNLAKKGILEAVSTDAKEVDLDDPSILSEKDAKARKEKAEEAHKEKLAAQHKH